MPCQWLLPSLRRRDSVEDIAAVRVASAYGHNMAADLDLQAFGSRRPAQVSYESHISRSPTTTTIILLMTFG